MRAGLVPAGTRSIFRLSSLNREFAAPSAGGLGDARHTAGRRFRAADRLVGDLPVVEERGERSFTGFIEGNRTQAADSFRTNVSRL